MQIALLAARLLLSGVFGVAGLAKLADRAGSRQALAAFGVPNVLAPTLAVLLPLAELLVALALLPVASARLGALGALSLLLLFIFGIALNLARGRAPDCRCFGQLSSAPVGWATLVRNVVLAAIAGFVAWSGWNDAGLSGVSWFVELTIAQRVLFIVGFVGLVLLAAEGWVLLQMLRQQGRLLLRLDALETRLASAGLAPTATENQDAPEVGLAVGTPAPPFRLKGLRGEILTLEALLNAGKPVLLFFTNPNCGPCQMLMPDVSRWQREHISALTIVPISEGTVSDNRAKSTEHSVTQVLLQQKREVAEAYQAYGTPSAVLIEIDGTIGSSLAMGADAIQALVARTSGTAMSTLSATVPQNGQNGNGNGAEQHVSIVQVGQLGPNLKLQNLNGKTIPLASFRGSKTLLLFWNPGCGFCTQMLDDLRELEAHPPPGVPKLLVISSGTVEDNLAMNLRSMVVLDPNFEAGSAFGANGTPMAVLLDAKGRVASELAAGAQAVLALAGVKPDEAAKDT
jgi:peroxiredoxin/uncharacterized membrane protein YphA (DoxX/SURF4 family)